MLKWQKNFFTKPDGLLKIKILFIKKFVWLLLNFPYYYLYLCMAWTSLPISFFSSLFFFPIFLKKEKEKKRNPFYFPWKDMLNSVQNQGQHVGQLLKGQRSRNILRPRESRNLLCLRDLWWDKIVSEQQQLRPHHRAGHPQLQQQVQAEVDRIHEKILDFRKTTTLQPRIKIVILVKTILSC